MHRILIVGIDTVAGANLAATLADRFRISGLSAGVDLPISECDSKTYREPDAKTAREWVSLEQPNWLIYCGSAAQSSWESPSLSLSDNGEIEFVCQWASAAANCDCGFVLISSDAVFTGPWMFHDENSRSVCPSRQACAIRGLENRVQSINPSSLIVRTNVFGWTPQSMGPSWIDQTLSELELQQSVSCDSIRHATPILATDLAEILSLAIKKQLQGVYHIAGAERVCPTKFAQRLAEQFGLPAPLPTTSASLSECPSGFGRGETSLKTTKIRKDLGVSVPLLDECLSRLYEQSKSGYCESLNGATIHQKVA